MPAIELAVPLAMMFLLAAPAARASIKIQPAIDARETYTDNVSLATDNGNNGQFVTEITPSISLVSNGPRVQMRLRGAGHLYAFSGDRPSGTNSSTFDVSGDGKARLIEELLFVDGSFNRARQSTSAFGPQVQNGYSNLNSDNITTYSISPYLQHQFGNFASAQLRYTYNGVDSQQVSQFNSTSSAVSLNLSSGPKFVRYSWQLSAYHQNLNDLVAGKSQVDNIIATLRYQLRDSFRVYVNEGYDRYTYAGLTDRSSGKSYAAGFTWTPSPRTSLDASAGRRYFGKTYSLAGTHRSRNTVWTTSYRDDITTARQQFLQSRSIDTATLLDATFASAFPDPIERRQAIDAYIRATGLPPTVAQNLNFISNRLYRQKQFQAAFVLNGSRSSLILSGDNSKRVALSTGSVDNDLPSNILSAFNDSTRQRGLTAAFSYRLSARSSLTANVTRTNTVSLTTGIEQQQTSFSTVLSRQIDRTLSGSVELRHNQGTSSFSAIGFRENAISANLSYRP